MSEALAKIGLYIKQERTNQGLNVKDLADKSRVSYSNIINIEEGIRDELPEDACLNGFIKILLKTLKVKDQDLVLADYQESLSSQAFVSLNNAGHEVNIEKSKVQRGQTLKRIAKVFILFFLVVLVFGFLLKNCSKKVSDVEAKKIVKPESLINKANNKEQLRTVDKVKDLGLVNLKFEIVDNAWFQLISVDTGKVLYEGDVFPNFGKRQFKFSDKYGFVLASGNAAAFKIKDSAKDYVLGEKNQLIKWFYPASAKNIYYLRREAEKLKEPN